MLTTNFAKRVREDFKMQSLGQYYDLYVQIDTCLLTDVFENAWNKCIVIYELDPVYF